MEQLYFFGLGMVTVFIVLSIGGIVRLKKQVQDLQENVRNIHDQLRETHRHVEDRVINLNKRVDEEIRALYVTLDSRLDKLENKLTTKK